MRTLLILVLLSGCAAVKERRLQAAVAKEEAQRQAAIAAEKARVQAEIDAEQAEAERLSAQVQITKPEFSHVGHSYTIEATGPEGLSLTIPQVSTETGGRFQTHVVATYKRGLVEIPVDVHIAEPTSSPWFPLEPGNRWIYDYSKSTRQTTAVILFIIPINKTKNASSKKGFLDIEIIEKVTHPTHVEYTGRISHNKEHLDVTFLPQNGRTLYKTEQGWAPFINMNETARSDAFADDKIGCEIPTLSLEQCDCNARPLGERFAPAGPEHCSFSYRVGQKASTSDIVGSAIIGLFSGGLFVPTGGRSRTTETVKLSSFRRPVAPNSVDNDPYLLTFASGKHITSWDWPKKFRAIQRRTPLKLDVAAALVKNNSASDSRLEIIGAAMAEDPDRARLLRLVSREGIQFQFAAFLNVPESQTFDSQIYRRHARLKSTTSARDVIQEVQAMVSIDDNPNSQLCKVLDPKPLRYLLGAMKERLDEAQRANWARQCAETVRASVPETHIQYHLGLPLPPLIEELYTLNRWPETEDVIRYGPRLAKKHGLTVDMVFQLMAFDTAFFNKRDILKALTPHLNEDQKAQIHGRLDAFDQRWAEKAMDWQPPAD